MANGGWVCGTAAGHHSTPPDLAARTDVGRESIANLRRIVARQVDLVLNAVEAKLHRLLGFAAVEVVGEHLNRSPGHVNSFPNGDTPQLRKTLAHAGRD